MSNLVQRAMAIYQNLPLPAGSAVGIIAVLLLDRVRLAPLPGPRALERAAGAAALTAGCALNYTRYAGRVSRYAGRSHRRVTGAAR
jgi:hypothetical protein